MQEKKVWFYIHDFPVEKTLKVADRFFKKYGFIKPTIENDKCILLCRDMGEHPSSWIIDKLIDSVKFLGKFCPKHLLYKKKRNARTVDRYYVAACRFGYFDVYDWPDDEKNANFILSKLKKQLAGIPFWLAERQASLETGRQLTDDESLKKIRRDEYISDLVKFFNYSKKDAVKLIDAEFPEWKNCKVKTLSPSEKAQRIKQEQVKIKDLVGKLAFMSPKQRKVYLNQNDNFADFMRFMYIVKSRGFSWVKDNIGTIPGFID